MRYKVFIPTAGIGSRLEELTKNLNKSLIGVVNKPIISHIIEKFPKKCEFVIALGHKGELVKNYLELAYPERVFKYIYVKPFKGKGSGLGYTLLSCKKYLQQPFIFVSCDTLVTEKIPEPNDNWVGYSYIKNLNIYRTLEIKQKKLVSINEKGIKISKSSKAYIGLAGIFDYSKFWNSMKSGKQIAINQGEAYGLNGILKTKFIKPIKFSWFDTGNLKNLKNTQRAFMSKNEPNILEKKNEAIWFVNKKVIKFSVDKKFINNRFIRAKKLKGFVPKVIDYKKNMYCYEKARGVVLSNIVHPKLFKNLLQYCEKFWKKIKLEKKNFLLFKKKCRNFYYNKTRERIKLFYKNFNKKDANEKINGKAMPKLSVLLKKVDWEDISNGHAGRFHGDFHFENILWQSNKKRFIFLDWRQDFAGDLLIGDIYYDLAKLLHGLIVSHDSVVKNEFKVKWNKANILISLNQKRKLKECEKIFYKWCVKNDLSIKKIKILTAIIFLNIAALHHYPYSLFLFALGKSMLKEVLIKKI